MVLYVLASRAEEEPFHPESKKEKCAKCRKLCWVSPSTPKRNRKIICMACFKKLPDDSYEIEKITEEQMDELIEIARRKLKLGYAM